MTYPCATCERPVATCAEAGCPLGKAILAESRLPHDPDIIPVSLQREQDTLGPDWSKFVQDWEQQDETDRLYPDGIPPLGGEPNGR